MNHRSEGDWAEELAMEHLCRHGLTLGTRNYRCKGGEIDLIMHHGESLVFVEVRYRTHAGFGDGAESVNRDKQRRILSTAEHYLQNRREVASSPCRFDVVAISGAKAQPRIRWIQNAFDNSAHSL